MTTNAFAILILIGGISAQEPTESPGWATLTVDNGALQISFPARPQKKSSTIQSAAGPIQQTVHFLKTGGCLFTLQEFHFPRAVPSARVPAQLASEKKAQVQGQDLIREQDIDVDGVEGGEFEFKGPSPLGKGSVTSLTRHFIKGATYYMMTVMSAPDQPLPTETKRFMDSIHFGVPKAGPAKANALAKSGAMTKSRTAPEGPTGSEGRARADAAAPSLNDGTPEAAFRSFMVAMLDHDEAALRALILPAPDRDFEWLLRGEMAPAGEAQKMRTFFAEMKFQRLKPGDRIDLPRGRSTTVRPQEANEDHAVLMPEGSPLPTRVQRVKGHWKVDARPVIAGRKAADAAKQKAKNR